GIAAIPATGRRPPEPRRAEALPPSAPPPTVAAAAVPPPTAAAELPTPPPTEAAPEATVVPQPSGPDAGRLRRIAEDARGQAKSARSAAERARAPEVAGALYESARKKEREGQRLLGDGRLEAAAASLDSAAALFRQAESWSRTAPERPAARVAALPPVREPPVPTAAPPPAPRRAEVSGHEKRLAIPRIGSEQSHSGVVRIQLEKTGGAWVIVGLR